MTITSTIIVGFIIGIIARFSRANNERMGLLFTVLISIIGALVGRFLGLATTLYSDQGASGVLGAMLGSILIIAYFKNLNSRDQLKNN